MTMVNNDFKRRQGELLPSELMRRVTESPLVPDGVPLVVLIKLGVHGLNVSKLSLRRHRNVRIDEIAWTGTGGDVKFNDHLEVGVSCPFES